VNEDRRPWVIIGCGYTGTHLARRLVESGAEVAVTRRTRAAADELASSVGVAAHVADLLDPATLDGVIRAGAIVVDSAPPSSSDGLAETSLANAAADAGAHRIVYISSTGVYPAGGDDSDWIDEDTPPAPPSERGQRRLAAETALLATAAARGVEAVSVRAAGIYGPDRGVIARMRAGTYRIIGEGNTHVCRVHVHDLVSAVVAAGLVDPLQRRVYNACDDEPCPSSAFSDAVAEAFDLPKAPRVPATDVPPAVAAMLSANRRVSNRRLVEELGVKLAYATWRDSLRLTSK
jgi:nucleoside-diphosphate-sugar epimerase